MRLLTVQAHNLYFKLKKARDLRTIYHNIIIHALEIKHHNGLRRYLVDRRHLADIEWSEWSGGQGDKSLLAQRQTLLDQKE